MEAGCWLNNRTTVHGRVGFPCYLLHLFVFSESVSRLLQNRHVGRTTTRPRRFVVIDRFLVPCSLFLLLRPFNDGLEKIVGHYKIIRDKY